VPLQERVRQALAGLQEHLASQSTEAELLSVQEGVAHVRLTGSGCSGSASQAVQTQVQQAVLQAAPELLQVQFAGTTGSAGASFIPLSTLSPTPGEKQHG
jgi:hypothetical protein